MAISRKLRDCLGKSTLPDYLRAGIKRSTIGADKGLTGLERDIATVEGLIEVATEDHAKVGEALAEAAREEAATDAANAASAARLAAGSSSFSLGGGNVLEAVALRMEGMARDPKEKLAYYEAGAQELRGMARAMRFNDSVGDALAGWQVDKERVARYREREAELLEEVERDFGDLSGTEFVASVKNDALMDYIFVKKPGDKFSRSMIRSRSKAGRAGLDVGGDYDGTDGIPGWMFGGNESPDTVAQTLYEQGLLKEPSPDALWDGIKKALKAAGAAQGTLDKYAERKRQAREQARTESNEWAAAEMAKLPARKKEHAKAEMLRGLQALDAILMKLPAEVRGKVGGFTRMASLETNEAREKYLLKRLDKAEKELERFLRKEYTARLKKLLERARKKVDEPGERPASKIGPDASRLLKAMADAMPKNETEVAGILADLDTRIASGDLTAEQEALATRERFLVEISGDWKNADSATMASAYNAAEVTFTDGWLAWSRRIVERREARAAMREALGTDTGKAGTREERDAKAAKEMGWTGRVPQWALSLSSFQEVATYVFGDSATARDFVDREREASNTREDEVQDAGDSAADLFTGLAGSPFKGTQLQHKLAMPSIETEKLGKLSELQAIQATFMWAQADGQRHMEADGVTQMDMDAIEAALSDKGKAVRTWLRSRYDAEHAPLNALYRERHGVDLPSHEAYAPLTVKPQLAKAGEMTDPVTGIATTGSILTPGSLRTRSRVAKAEPEYRDALQTYLAHVRQLAHWKAYYPLATDMQAIFGNRDLGNQIEAKGGKEAVNVLRLWKDFFAQGGNRDAGAFLALNRGMNRLVGRAAEMILFGRVGTLIIQSTQLGASLAEMPTFSYVKRFGMLFAGKLGWGDAIRSEYIQRRMAQAPPIVRQAMDALAASPPNRIKHAAQALGRLIAGADALFTAGTYAITLDYHRTQGAKAGMTGVELDSYAHKEAERSVDRVAQPTRQGARSLFENTSTSALARAGWAFASEARQKIALAAWAMGRWKKEPAKASRAIAVVWGIGGLVAALIRSAWRDMRDDDDEELFDPKNWSAARITSQAIAGPLQGIPAVGGWLESIANKITGTYAPDGDIFSQVGRGAESAVKLAKGKTLDGNEPMEDTMRELKGVLFTLGITNDTLAGAAGIANLIEDALRTVDAIDGKEAKIRAAARD